MTDHLIGPIRDVSLDECLATLRARYEELLEPLQEALNWDRQGTAAKDENVATWLKRNRRVQLQDGASQPLDEVVNQLATVERLMEALYWYSTVQDEAHVLVCHPTTSHDDVAERPDHDAVISDGPNDPARAVFEAGDIAGASTMKVRKDLARLGWTIMQGPAIEAYIATSLTDERASRVLTDLHPDQSCRRKWTLELQRSEGETSIYRVHKLDQPVDH